MKIESAASYQNIAQRTQLRSSAASDSFANFVAQDTKGASAAPEKIQSGKVETYDFTHMTASELHDAMGSLIRSGKMDLDQSSSLLGLTSSLSPLSKVSYDGTAPYSNVPMNVFDSLQKNFDAQMSRNEVVSAGYTKKAIDALTNLQGTPVQEQA